jgi:hypothetical protein
MGRERKTTATGRSDADPFKKADPSSLFDPAASPISFSITFAAGHIEIE